MKVIYHTLVLLLAVLALGCGQGDRNKPSLAVKEGFPILRGPAEHFPRALRSHLAHLLSNASAQPFQPRLVQRKRTAAGVVWLFVDGEAVCLAQGSLGSVACSNAKRARSEGVSLGVFSPPSAHTRRPHNFLLMGLTPDGVTGVIVSIGKRRHMIDVRDNLFSATGDRPILIRRFIGGRG